MVIKRDVSGKELKHETNVDKSTSRSFFLNQDAKTKGNIAIEKVSDLTMKMSVCAAKSGKMLRKAKLMESLYAFLFTLSALLRRKREKRNGEKWLSKVAIIEGGKVLKDARKSVKSRRKGRRANGDLELRCL